MDDIEVHVQPDNKTVPAYRYAPSVILVQKRLVLDTAESIVTDSMGLRYKRRVYTGESPWTLLSEYWLM